MKITRYLNSKIGKLASIGMVVWMLGVAYVPPAVASVTVDQQPLIIQAALPPNIVLMLDDSGSMASDYMPDWEYLSDTSNDGVRSSSINGTYYNPNVIYTLPPKSDGASTFPAPATSASNPLAAWVDGFTNQTLTDVTRYTGSYPYYTQFSNTTTAVSSTYSPIMGCASGDSLVSSGSHTGQCKHGSGSNATYYTPNVPGCKSGDTYDSANKVCDVITSTTTTVNLFTYTTVNSGGGYTRHYVGKSQAECAYAPANTCVYDSATQRNVVNWFSYYSTRIRMAKSGVMTAFASVDPTYRVGFGSINGTNNGGLPSLTYSANSKTLAKVQPFGDGSATTQKAKLWSWLAPIVPNNSTPLRTALDTVGQYYSQAQPWQTSSSDTTELACRLSYTILTTDGFWNETNFTGYGNVDGTAATTAITGPNNQTYTYSAKAPYADSYTNTLADVAMKYWETDLRTGDLNEVPTSTEDPAFWQHMTTFTLGLGFAPTGISPAGTTVDQIFTWANGGSAINGFSWPQPVSNTIANIADLAHAAVNGHGGFYSATSPQSFTSGLQSALNRAAERLGSGASLAANSAQLQSGTMAYQATYHTATWSGDLLAFTVDPNTGAIATTSSWKASEQLPAAASRNIWTYNPSAASGSQYVAFQNGASAPPALSSAQLASLGSGATAQQNMVNYLRGDSTYEVRNSGTYRNRTATPLGDFVDSQPIYEGAPNANQFYQQTFTGSSAFASYASTKASRQAVVWLAGNDGMLHAFNASTGAEIYAYLPGAVITDGLTSGGAAGTYPLKDLADPTYGQTSSSFPHQYFNDGQFTIADAYFGNAWHTVLVGTTGRGPAEAVYALDVTDPTNVSFLWERSATDGQTNSNYIGQMTGQPVIAQIATSSGSKWVVLMGNGYNSQAGTGALLQFDLSNGTLNVYPTDSTSSNGLAAPAVWISSISNGLSTTAYAGDNNGRVWSFTLTSAPVSANAGTALFTAKDANNNVQPITAGMLVGQDPATSNIWLFFGTGQYLSSSDLTNLKVQTWYGLIVQNNSGTTLTSLSSGRSALKQRSIIYQTSGDNTVSPPILPARAVTQSPSTPDMAGVSGWYIDLVEPTSNGPVSQGERMVTPNQFQGNLLIGTTRIPQATDICNPSGSGWIMAVSPFTGTAPSSSFFDVNGNGVINSSDMLANGSVNYVAAGVGFSSLPNNPIFSGGNMMVSFDNGSNASIKTSNTSNGTQRVSWREMVNQ